MSAAAHRRLPQIPSVDLCQQASGTICLWQSSVTFTVQSVTDHLSPARTDLWYLVCCRHPTVGLLTDHADICQQTSAVSDVQFAPASLHPCCEIELSRRKATKTPKAQRMTHTKAMTRSGQRKQQSKRIMSAVTQQPRTSCLSVRVFICSKPTVAHRQSPVHRFAQVVDEPSVVAALRRRRQERQLVADALLRADLRTCMRSEISTQLL